MEKFMKKNMVPLVQALLCYTVISICIGCTSIYATDFFSKAQSGLSNIYTQLLGLTLPVAAVCFIFCCLCAFFASSPQSTQRWVSYAKRIVICYAAVMAVGYIFKTVDNLIGDSAHNLFGN